MQNLSLSSLRKGPDIQAFFLIHQYIIWNALVPLPNIAQSIGEKGELMYLQNISYKTYEGSI
jgi:hypothetical protein